MSGSMIIIIIYIKERDHRCTHVRCSSVVRAFDHDAMGRQIDPSWREPIELFLSLQPVLHDWCNKGRGMCYPVCGMVHIKEPLLLIGKSSLYIIPCSTKTFRRFFNLVCFHRLCIFDFD